GGKEDQVNYASSRRVPKVTDVLRSEKQNPKTGEDGNAQPQRAILWFPGPNCRSFTLEIVENLREKGSGVLPSISHQSQLQQETFQDHRLGCDCTTDFFALPGGDEVASSNAEEAEGCSAALRGDQSTHPALPCRALQRRTRPHPANQNQQHPPIIA